MTLSTTPPAPHHPHILALALTATAVLALSGCGAQEDASFTCGPEEEPRECGWRETRRANAAFDEVEEKYRAILRDVDAMLMAPEEERDLTTLDEHSIDPYRTGEIAVLDDFKDAGLYLDERIPVTRVDPLFFDDDQLSIAVCTDASNVAARRIGTSEFVEYGGIVRMKVAATELDDEWKISSAEQIDFETCKN